MTRNIDKAGQACALEEIEVTPEMVEAGKSAYSEYFLDLDSDDCSVPEKMVKAVFSAMLRAVPSHRRPPRVSTCKDHPRY
jgi:hypothetical protein